MASFHEQMATGPGVQALAKEWFDADVPDGLAAVISETYAKTTRKRVKDDKAKGYHICAAGPCVWLKSRLNCRGMLPVSGAPPNDDDPGPVSAVLHVGFVGIHESEEMLERLRSEFVKRDPGAPARSKVFKQLARETIAPIDGTAARVAPEKEEL